MGSKKTTTTQKNTYGYVPYQNTQDSNYARNLIQQGVDLAGPVAQQYARAENDIENQVFERDLPEGVRERIRAGDLFNVRQMKGQAMSAARGQEHAIKTGNAMNFAGMTQNKFVQTGGTQTTVQPYNWGAMLGQGLMGAASLAAAIPTGGASVAAGAA